MLSSPGKISAPSASHAVADWGASLARNSVGVPGVSSEGVSSEGVSSEVMLQVSESESELRLSRPPRRAGYPTPTYLSTPRAVGHGTQFPLETMAFSGIFGPHTKR